MTPFRLGPFELESPIGMGGMGEVWLGRHREQDLPVAVKVITAQRAREGDFQSAFRTEVKAVAGLDHPGIVLVFDFGEVSAEAAAESGGVLLAGSPYLVMEHISGGSLNRRPPPASWSELRGLLVELLEALAHAHARGVIHRDLKPGNVLLGLPEDVRPGYRIIDFGLAGLDLDRGGSPHKLSAGTPAFEAPEQILGHWRDQGPWTDLYALGCIAYALAAGRPPFYGDDIDRVHRCHLMVPMPMVANRIPVPRGFEGWLARLLAKHPSDRFRSAASAQHALLSLPKSTEAGSSKTRPAAAPPEHRAPRHPLTRAEAETKPIRTKRPTPPDQNASRQHVLATSTETEEPMAVRLPPLQADWRDQGTPAPRSPGLVGAGLGLYGLRSVPFVDRDRERDELWQCLRSVRRAGRARLVLLQGAAGTGKSRLAEWLTERSHELAGADTLHAVHSRIEGPPDGLSRMVARHLGCVGLSRDEVEARLEAKLTEQSVTGSYEWQALTELIAPATLTQLAGGAQPVLFKHPAARYALIHRLVEREARQRPVIIWLDDVQWGFDALVFAKRFMLNQSRHPCPVLVVLTAETESLAEEPRNSRILGEILELAEAEALDIGALDQAACAELVSALLGLEGELVEAVVARTAGNPLFAVQLLGDWVERGVLESTPGGFRLRPGEAARLPDDLHSIWRTRVDRVLSTGVPSERAEPARRTLELAAALGRDVDEAELGGVALEAGIALDESVVEALEAARLARTTPGGWSFVHGMLRESIERHAREAGRWPELNRCCAEMLERLYEPSTPGIADRLGRHRLEGGQPERAIGPLLAGARERYERAEFLSALTLLDLREEAIERVGIDDSDRTWGEGWVQRARVHVLQGQLDRALHWASRAEESARHTGWRDLRANALRSMAYATQQKGDLARAERLYEEARDEFELLGSTEGVAACLNGLGEVARLQGEFEEATELNRRALALFETCGDSIGAAKCLRGLGVITQHREDFGGAMALFARALEQYREQGNPYGVAVCVNDLAEVKRWQGEIEAAETDYRRARDIYETIGSLDGVITQLNLGLVLITRGRWREARRLLTQSQVSLERIGRLGFLGGAHVALLACAARAADWEAFDVHLERSATLIERTAMVDGDLAWPAHLAGDLAADAGEIDRAAAAYGLALSQYRALGDETNGERVAAALAAIGRPAPAA